MGMALIAVEHFLAGERVLYAVPTQDQIDRFWFECKEALAPAIDAGIVYKNETRHILEIPGTQNRIRAKTAWDADTLRGDYADLLILDEYQLMNEDAWAIVGAPMLMDTNGNVVFAFTPPSFRSAGTSKAHDPRHADKLYAAHLTDDDGRWATFHFTSYDNPHLSSEALDDITKDMTVMAHRQEILAEQITDIPGALWTQKLLDATRVAAADVPDLVRLGIALDPAATSSDTSDEMGIVAGGRGANGHGYILRDASLRGTPMACARHAIFLYDTLEADVLIAEVNNGGEWIGTVLALVAADMWRKGERPTKELHYKQVHASRGKVTRAEPIAAIFERERAHIVGTLPDLEEQLVTWVPGMRSPDRSDAMVWLATELLLGHQPKPTVPPPLLTRASPNRLPVG